MRRWWLLVSTISGLSNNQTALVALLGNQVGFFQVLVSLPLILLTHRPPAIVTVHQRHLPLLPHPPLHLLLQCIHLKLWPIIHIRIQLLWRIRRPRKQIKRKDREDGRVGK